MYSAPPVLFQLDLRGKYSRVGTREEKAEKTRGESGKGGTGTGEAGEI